MVTSLSNLVEMIQGGVIPAWLREYFMTIVTKIVNALREKGVYNSMA